MLLEQPDDEDLLHKVSRRGQEGLREEKEAMTYQVKVVSIQTIHHLLWLILRTTPLPPKD
jgi:hypothetical protein